MRIEFLADRFEFVEPAAEWLLAEWPAAVEGSREEARRVLRMRASRTLPCALVATEADALAGMIALVYDRPPARGDEIAPFLGGLFVAPAFRNRGVGSALCLRAEEEALRFGIDELYLFTDTAVAYYERRGWRRLSDTNPACMHKPLTNVAATSVRHMPAT